MFWFGHAGLCGQFRLASYAAACDARIAKSAPPRAQPQHSAATSAQSVSRAHESEVGWKQSQVRQPFPSEANPDEQLFAHVVAAHAT